MDGFNARVTERRGVEFSAYAGDVDAYTCVPGSERGDMEVPLSSARWSIEDAETGDVSHVEMPASGAIFSDFVKPRLTGQKGTSSVAARRAAAEAPRRHAPVAPAADATDRDGGARRRGRGLARCRRRLAAGGTALSRRPR